MSESQALKYLQGKRIYLRRLKPDDVEHYIIATSDANLRRLTGTVSFFTTKMIEQAFQKWEVDSSRIDLIICLNENHKVIGDLAMLDIEQRDRKGSFRIAITDEEYTSKGYGHEVLKLVVDYMFHFLNLRRISINVYAFNERAIKAYQKLGFQIEGVLKEDLFYDGKYHDNIMMALLKSDYEAAGGIPI